MTRSIVMLMTLLGALLVAGCECAPGHECAASGETRCAGSRAEICDGDLRWQAFIDCDELGREWVCGRVDEGHTCVLRDDESDGGSR